MGGKSRKSGGVSRKLIARIKNEEVHVGNKLKKSSTTNEKTNSTRRSIFDSRPTTEDKT